jgi:hypothetical protein
MLSRSGGCSRVATSKSLAQRPARKPLAVAARKCALRVLGHAGGMDVELLVVPDCPHETSAYDLTLAALTELNVTASVSVTVIDTDEQAQARGFTGSPTFLIEGRDPFAEPGARVGLACRMYPTPSGLSGVPGLDALREELRSSLLA